MNDYIEREAALTAIKHAELGEEYEVVESLPAAEVRPVRWIPVTEQLPEDSGHYIVCAEDGIRIRVTYVQYQSRHESWLLSGARAYWRITHWMPLPEPPKEDDHD